MNLARRRSSPSSIIKKRAYWQRVKSVFGSSIVAHWPLKELSGTVVTDVSGNKINGTYANITLANTVGLNLRPVPLFNGTNSRANILSTPFTNAFNTAEGTIIGLAKIDNSTSWTNGLTKHIIDWEIDSNNRILIRKESVNNRLSFYYVAGGTSKSVLTNVTPFNQITTPLWFDFALTWSKSGDKVAAYINGLQLGVTQTGLGTWSGTINWAGIGNAGSNDSWPGWISDVATASRALTADEIYAISPRPRIVFDGDSRSTSDKIWCDTVYNNNNKIMGLRNVAISGEGLPTMIANAATNVDVLHKSTQDICVVWGGVNGSSVGANTLYADLQTYCLARRSAGWKVVVCSEIDAQDISRNAVGWHQTIWPALNALLAADHSFADGYADLGANVNLQDATNLTYFNADQVHPNATGFAIVANIVSSAISSL